MHLPMVKGHYAMLRDVRPSVCLFYAQYSPATAAKHLSAAANESNIACALQTTELPLAESISFHRHPGNI